MAREEHIAILINSVEHWNKWRNENPSVMPGFGGTKFFAQASATGIVFHSANFSCSYFRDADLSNTQLQGADLNSSDFQSAHLENANLSQADLANANFTDACLVGADLFGTNLSGATFHNADLKGANLGGTIFSDNDLSRVKNLDKVRHSGPSLLDTSTLKRSGANIPQEFLRGCGLNDWEIEAAKLHQVDLTPIQISEILYHVNDLRSNPFIQFYSCFISYSHVDREFACTLHDRLQNSGIRCWLDARQLLPGDKLYTEVDRGIRLWDKVLLCCSEAALTSWWVDNEIQIAFDKEQRLWKEKGTEILALIPLDLDGFMFSPNCQSGKATQLRSRLASDFSGWETNPTKLNEQFERVIKALRADPGGRETPPISKL